MTFLFVLLFGPDFLPGWFMRSKEAFLDKTCIHHVDQTLQREGIESLGGFVFFSGSMTVLCTREYTRKLWTVYEMACCLCVHPEGRLEWLLCDLACVVVVSSVAGWMNDCVSWAVHLYQYMITNGVGSVMGVFDSVVDLVHGGASAQFLLSAILWGSAWALAFFPLLFTSSVFLCGRCMHLTGIRENALVVLVSLVVLLFTMLVHVMISFLRLIASDNMIVLAIWCLISALLLCFSYFVSRRPRGQQRKRRTDGTNCETIEELAKALTAYVQHTELATSPCESLLKRRVDKACNPLDAIGRYHDTQGAFALLLSCTG